MKTFENILLMKKIFNNFILKLMTLIYLMIKNIFMKINLEIKL